MKSLLSIILVVCLFQSGKANFITANPSNYTSFLGNLIAGDTLHLTGGNYTQRLNLSNKNGTATDPIVIEGEGNATTFLANACCNTVDFTNCSYIVFRNFRIDGQNINYVDGVKAGGGGNTFAHHITLERLTIVNNGGNIDGDNQTVGISTKCAAWNWTVRYCIIIGAGTGMYFGNSDGTSPFVAGVIENNLVINTRGYNIQVKHQLDNVRQIFPGTSIDSQKTIIRYNVFSKESGSTQIGEGDGSRPCLLMDNFPSTGFGSHDMYEVYGNLFYQNPTEALMQVTGNTTAYANLFYNDVAPSGYPPVVMTNHNGFPPRTMNFFHNTVVTNCDEAGVGLYGANQSYEQYCYANAVFSNGTPIVGFKPANSVNNVTDVFSNADNYLNDPFTPIPGLDMYPLTGQLHGNGTSSSLFISYTDFYLDFNGDYYDWSYRGAYSGSGENPGRPLALDTMPTPHGTITGFEEVGGPDFAGIIYPNPAGQSFYVSITANQTCTGKVNLMDIEGRVVANSFIGNLEAGKNVIKINLPVNLSGFYLVNIQIDQQTITRKILIRD